MVNRLRGEVVLGALDPPPILRPTFQALLEIEDALEDGIVEITIGVAEGRYGYGDTVRILHPCIVAAGRDISVEAVGMLVARAGLIAASPLNLLEGVLDAGPRRKSNDASEGSKELDWRLFGEIAAGALGWAPDEFWRATPHEFWMAYDGWCTANLPKDEFGDEFEPYSEDELAFIARAKAKDGPIDKSKRRALTPENIREFMGDNFGKENEAKSGKRKQRHRRRA